MEISATVTNSLNENHISVETQGNRKEVFIPAREGGRGLSVNGAEVLFLSLATCFCNDLYREAGRRQISIESVVVKVSGKFGREGEPGSDIRYSADIKSDHPPEMIRQLVHDVDKVAEVHNTLRQGVSVSLRI